MLLLQLLVAAGCCCCSCRLLLQLPAEKFGWQQLSVQLQLFINKRSIHQSLLVQPMFNHTANQQSAYNLKN
jgi:hypothetical protein